MKGSIRWKEVLSKYRYVLLVLAAGLCLMALPPGEAEETEVSLPEAQPSAQLWREELEGRLAQALSRIDGVGETSVVLTLVSGPETVLARDSREGEEETVVLSGQAGEETVTLVEHSPRLRGALIVCQGGGSARVKLEILQAVQALTGLGADQISICKGMGGAET